MSWRVTVQEGTLVGTIQSTGKIVGSVKTDGSLVGTVVIATSYDDYIGEYEITPTVDGTTIPTADKRMRKDVTINPIPFFDVSNESGGTTIYIGNEV